MLSYIWSLIKRLTVGPPKGEGKFLRIYINYDIKSGAKPVKMKKIWQKYFRGTDFCFESSGEFEEFIDEFSVSLSPVPGILGFAFIKGCKKGNTGFLINSVDDCTDQELRRLDRNVEVLELEASIKKDMKENSKESLERATEKKLQLQQLKGGGPFTMGQLIFHV